MSLSRVLRFASGPGLVLFLLLACSKAGGGSVPGIDAAAKANAKTTFQAVCSVCHGMQGKGDGPGSATLEPKPRNLADKAWQCSVDDQHIRKVITLGGAAVGKSPIMPAHPQLKHDNQALEALIAHVRGLAN